MSWEDLAPAFDEKAQHVKVAVDWSRGLKDPAIEGELKAVLGGAIDELPADYRTAFLLHDVEGLSNPEIAQTLHVKLGTIKSRVHRARLFLRNPVGRSRSCISREPDSIVTPTQRKRRRHHRAEVGG